VKKGEHVTLLSRNQEMKNATFPELVEPLRQQSIRDFNVDGEVVAFAGTRTNISRLQRRLGITDVETPQRTAAQWTHDFVLLPPAGPKLRGRSAIAEAFRGVENRVEVLEAVFDIHEVKVLGDHAFQWGTYHQSVRSRQVARRVRGSGKLMRILQRQPDGSWKMYRTIFTVDPPTP
jgi:ketosteroid isomerase-like protein